MHLNTSHLNDFGKNINKNHKYTNLCSFFSSQSQFFSVDRLSFALGGATYFNGGMIEHFLPGIVELPFMWAAHETLLGQRHRLLRRCIYFCARNND